MYSLIAPVLAAAVLIGGGWYIKHDYDEGKREEGRAEVRVEFDAYKLRVQEATQAAYAQSLRASAAVRAITDNVTIVYRDRNKQLDSANESFKTEIASAAIPECRIDDRVRDALNAVRSRAAGVVDDTYRSASTVPQTERGGRLPREPR